MQPLATGNAVSVGIGNKSLNAKLQRNFETARKARADAMEKVASGEVFTSQDPRPAERAFAEKMDFRLRSLTANRRNINEAITLLQTAESGFSEVNNIILRMKELNLQGASTTVSDQERRYLLIEYEALHNELDRIGLTTEFNGIPILNGQSDRAPEELIFRLDDPYKDEDGQVSDESDDINTIRFSGIRDVVATSEGLGLNSALDILKDYDAEEGVPLEDLQDLMEPEDDEAFATIYDEALNRLSSARAIYGALQSRMHESLNYMDVYQENIAAAKSAYADTDYAKEIMRIAESGILMQASSGLLAQSNFDTNMTLNLLGSVMKG